MVFFANLQEQTASAILGSPSQLLLADNVCNVKVSAKVFGAY